MTIRNPFQALANAALLCLPLISVQAAQPEYKGYAGICVAGCANFAFNTDPPAAQPPVQHKTQPKHLQPEEPQYLQIDPAQLPPQDLAVNFRYSPPGGNGRTYALDNGSVLFDGDEFTIRLNAREDLYVYIFLFDSQGQATELVTHPEYGLGSNLIPAGEWELPKRRDNGTTRHLYLDNNPGLETFHFIAAPEPLDDLMASYHAGALSNAALQRPETKGILWADDIQAAPKRQGPRRFSCPASAEYCRETFTIEHRPAAQRL